MFTITFCECFCLFVTVEEPQYYIFHKHVTRFHLTHFLVCLTHEVGSSANGNWQRGKLAKWELTKGEVDQMGIDEGGSWPNGNWQRGKLTKWELTKWEVNQMGIDKVGSWPNGNWQCGNWPNGNWQPLPSNYLPKVWLAVASAAALGSSCLHFKWWTRVHSGDSRPSVPLAWFWKSTENLLYVSAPPIYFSLATLGHTPCSCIGGGMFLLACSLRRKS